MKEALKRMLGMTQASDAVAEAVVEQLNEGVDMTVAATNEGAGLSAEMVDQVAGLTATVTSLTEQLSAAMTKNAELSAMVEAATEFKANQEKLAAEAKVTSRVSKLSAVVGTVQAASLQAATAALDDAAFDAVVSAMTVNSTVEANTAAFKEVGAEGATDQAKLAAEVVGGKTADYLQAIVRKEIN